MHLTIAYPCQSTYTGAFLWDKILLYGRHMYKLRHHYPHFNGLIGGQTRLMKNALSKAKVSRILLPQALIKQWQIPIGTNLPSPTETLQPYGHAPEPSPQKHAENLWNSNQLANSSRKRLPFPKLHNGQEILFLTTKGNWLLTKITEINQEPIH